MLDLLLDATQNINLYLLPIKCKKGKGKGHPCTGTETLYRPYGP